MLLKKIIAKLSPIPAFDKKGNKAGINVHLKSNITNGQIFDKNGNKLDKSNLSEKLMIKFHILKLMIDMGTN